MRAIFHRIAICVAITVALFLFVPKAHALTWNLDLKEEALIFTGVDYKEYSGSFTNTDGRAYFAVQFDNVYQNTNNYKYAVFSVMSILFYSNKGILVPGTTLPGGTTLNYDFTNSSTYLSTQRIILYGDYGGAWSNCEWQNNYLVCPINPGQKYNRMAFWFESNSSVDLYYRIAFAPTVQLYNLYGVSSSDIQNQTDAIQNSDAPSDATYNNDYSTQSYDQAESSVNSSMNVDVSNFVFNPSQWINAFNWIWQTLTSFVQINGKVFATITSFLTFSFVGLVIGRS